MESAEAPTQVLHKNVGQSLDQLGHHKVSTVPPNEGPVLAEDLKDMVEDMGYNASSTLEQAVKGGVTNVRTTESKKPFLIARGKQFLREKILSKFKKAA